ncbi:TonB family protein [Lysobacter sp. GX 14042]|uniref:TonB family protein n=1 Tax=Lysobacter sp. GX 14042 TaxID=2907155 RepID=UPI001F45DBEB|nr:TonB family protein [Lysobacter sp. GX 14042]MCE7033543.1 TonB family protein [Lysobacter sp. GX 14042]
MESAELLAWVVEGALATALATALVLLARRPVRRLFGARTAYGLWALVPAALLATLLPASGSVAEGVVMKAPLGIVQVQARAVAEGASAGATLLAAWLAGLLATAVIAVLAQRRFLRSLGRLQLRADGLHQADTGAGLPAAVGLLRPRIVVPSDFDLRYDAGERELMRLHEQLHIRSGDLLANAAATAVRCLFWFNPLLHVAWPLFRHDQELACDQRVLARHPASRRCYGEAMLKTQLAAVPLPLACNWGYGHPLMERIAMLKQPLPSSRRRFAGTAAVCVLASAVAFTAWAAQPAAGAAHASVDSDTRMQNPPKYPAEAVEQRIEGRVVLLVDVDARGRTQSVVVESAYPEGVFEAATLEAARNWTFNPAMKDGRPVAGRVRVPVDFAMDPPEDEAAR